MSKKTSYKISIFFSLFYFLSFMVSSDPVEHKIKISDYNVEDKQFINIEINAKILDGYYMYSQDTLNLFPTRIELFDSSFFVNIDPMKSSRISKKKYDKFLKSDFFFYEDSISFYQTFEISNLLDTDSILFEGEFIFQACDDTKCIPYYSSFEKNINIDVSKEINNSKSNNSVQTGNEGIVNKFFFAFVAGLVAIFTPCVFPMIPMTVAFFSKGSNKSRTKAIKSGISFGVAIISIFITFGVLFSFIFKTADIMNEIATADYINIFFALIFIFFAISFFGFFEIRLPNKFLNKINRKADKSAGIPGIIFMALTLVLVSFSCTAPIVGTVMIDAVSGNFWGPILAMFGFSLAFAIPFSLFAVFPSWLENLPKSGGWLNTIKVVLGFIELGLAIKFLSMPDQAYHWGLLPRNTFLVIWILISGCMSLYLLGFIKFPNDSKKKINFGFGRVVLIIINLSFMIYMFFGIMGYKVTALAGIIPPEKLYCMNDNNLCSEMNSKFCDKLSLPHGLCGFFDYDQALEYAKNRKMPLFIDFTGHACFNCRRMEEIVWSNPEVLNILKNDFIVVALYVDDRTLLEKEDWYISSDSKVRKTIGKKNFFIQYDMFQANAQPYYVIVNPFESGLEQNRNKLIKPLVEPLGYNTDINNFINFLNLGKSNFYDQINN
ncbi:MAG: disulfide bond formation protein DsbD [Candidatus Marinimicrobia bacterium]|nr:disulfide bond formation protein DsbD [Candidatus Neomarinimicrobiota bacterium]